MFMAVVNEFHGKLCGADGEMIGDEWVSFGNQWEETTIIFDKMEDAQAFHQRLAPEDVKSLEELIAAACPTGHTMALVHRKDGSWSANLMVHNKLRRPTRAIRGVGETIEAALLDFIRNNQPKD